MEIKGVHPARSLLRVPVFILSFSCLGNLMAQGANEDIVVTGSGLNSGGQVVMMNTDPLVQRQIQAGERASRKAVERNKKKEEVVIKQSEPKLIELPGSDDVVVNKTHYFIFKQKIDDGFGGDSETDSTNKRQSAVEQYRQSVLSSQSR